METMLMMVLLFGGGCWAFKQYKSVTQPPSGGVPMVRPSETTLESGQWQEVPPKPKLRINKYVMIALCVIYILSPIDLLPDFIPALGWGDDLAVGVLGVKTLFSKG